MRQHSKTLGISGELAVLVSILCLVITLVASLTALNEVQSQGDGKPLGESLQLVIVVTRSWEAVDGSLQRYERPNLTSAWRPVGPKIPLVVGRNGMGWGGEKDFIRILQGAAQSRKKVTEKLQPESSP